MLSLLVAPPPSALQSFVLGAVQGLTELLPVSSSAHLYLVPTLLGWRYEGVAFDVALHAGTLVALVVAFQADWRRLFAGALSRDPAVAAATRRTLGQLALATVPALVAGKLLSHLEDELRIPLLQASTLFVFGALLWLADRAFGPGRDEEPGWGRAFLIGASQALALVPGVSRSGITLTTGRASGLSRIAAARFSFLLATPVTLAAVVYEGRKLPHDVPMSSLAIGIVSAAVFGLIAIRFLLGLVRRTGFGVFFAYRALLALGIVIWVVRAR